LEYRDIIADGPHISLKCEPELGDVERIIVSIVTGCFVRTPVNGPDVIDVRYREKPTLATDFTPR
jgi:hypothetical protein